MKLTEQKSEGLSDREINFAHANEFLSGNQQGILPDRFIIQLRDNRGRERTAFWFLSDTK
jgi:hypothetical protein